MLARIAMGMIAAAVGLALVGCEELANGFGLGPGAGAEAGTSDAGVDSAVVGGGCGTESSTGTTLCIATSMCPDVVVDTQATPHCGFRVRGASVDLVCGCGTSICPMGVFATCAEARALLASQTESAVCTQIAEDRCTETTAPTAPSACDRACMRDCGGGSGCAAVCNC
jgi:hypothetical protein